jgi:hypothetical protein
MRGGKSAHGEHSHDVAILRVFAAMALMPDTSKVTGL